MHRLAIPALAAASALVVAGAAAATGRNALPALPPGWSHAEINVVVRHAPHTLVYDRGRVVTVTASSLTLRERDGSIVAIAVSPGSRIAIDGRPASLAQVRRFEIATTLRIDGGAATRVSVRIPPVLAAAWARRQARMSGGG